MTGVELWTSKMGAFWILRMVSFKRFITIAGLVEFHHWSFHFKIHFIYLGVMAFMVLKTVHKKPGLQLLQKLIGLKRHLFKQENEFVYCTRLSIPLLIHISAFGLIRISWIQVAYEGENNNNHKRNLFTSFPKTSDFDCHSQKSNSIRFINAGYLLTCFIYFTLRPRFFFFFFVSSYR